MPIIHIAPNIDYLFHLDWATVLCGSTASVVIDAGEFIGLKGNLNPKCEVCPECLKKSNES